MPRKPNDNQQSELESVIDPMQMMIAQLEDNLETVLKKVEAIEQSLKESINKIDNQTEKLDKLVVSVE